MPKPFDASLKYLIEGFPRDWLDLLRVPVTGDVEVLTPELSTVTAAADSVIRVGGTVVHIDAESGPDLALPIKLGLYNLLVHRETRLPVHSVAVLLRPTANAGGFVSRLAYAPRPNGGLTFDFELVKVWETPTADLLTAGLGVLPLAVLGKPPKGRTRKQAIPDAMEVVAKRATAEAPRENLGELLATAMVLCGMYLTREEIEAAIQRFPNMIESTTYDVLREMARREVEDEVTQAVTQKVTQAVTQKVTQAVTQKVTKDAKREILIQLGTSKFGDPTEEQLATVKAIESVARLDRLVLRLLSAPSWDVLLKGR